MKVFRNAQAISLLLVLFITLTARGQFFAPDAIVEEKTIPEWVEETINWEIWLLSQDPPLSTFDVHPNNLASIDNDRPVFFIAGLDINNPDTTILVPPGRPILQRLFQIFDIRFEQEVDAMGVPVSISGNPVDGERLPDPDGFLNAIENVVNSPPLSPFFWEYDGIDYSDEQIEAHRVKSFYTAVVPENFFDVPMGEYPLSPEVGFWFMHEPFELGEEHTVKLGSLTADGERFPEFTIRLVAVPEPTSLCLFGLGIVALINVSRNKSQGSTSGRRRRGFCLESQNRTVECFR